MDIPNASTNPASCAEEGRAGTYEVKEFLSPSLSSPNTLSGSTLATSRTKASSKISFNRIGRTFSGLKKRNVQPPRKSNRMKTRKLEEYPMGYPRVSCYLDSDDAFMIYRRFGLLQSRLLLHKQDELRKMEEELLTMDTRDDKTEEGQDLLRCWSRDRKRVSCNGKETRKQLMGRIEKASFEYGQILLQAQQLANMSKPSKRDHASVVNFIEAHQPLSEQDRSFIYHKEDLVTLKNSDEHTWLDSAVERLLGFSFMRLGFLERLFTTEETRQKTTSKDLHYFSHEKISIFVTFIITFIVLTLLIIPIWILYYLTVTLHTSTTDTICIAVLLISTLIFSVCLLLFTAAKRHEILAAAAA
ncbi:hypothetical protein MMC17_005420 [Xylographa soralifera]|nr:hypothetical protein [Xylographa soralifera]